LICPRLSEGEQDGDAGGIVKGARRADLCVQVRAEHDAYRPRARLAGHDVVRLPGRAVAVDPQSQAGTGTLQQHESRFRGDGRRRDGELAVDNDPLKAVYLVVDGHDGRGRALFQQRQGPPVLLWKVNPVPGREALPRQVAVQDGDATSQIGGLQLGERAYSRRGGRDVAGPGEDVRPGSYSPAIHL
jgi:hypothetical protein